MARCPHCREEVEELLAVPMVMKRGIVDVAGTAYVCPWIGCRMIISAETDDITATEDYID